MAHRYRPGGWPAVVCEHGCLVVGPAVDAVVVDRLFRALSSGADQRALLDLLDSTGWQPPYALVLRGSDGRGFVSVRGELSVGIRAGEEHVYIDGGDSHTTQSPLAAAVVRTMVDDPPTGPDLAISMGVVLAVDVSLTWPVRAAPPPKAPRVLQVSTGMTIPLDKPLLIGSAPSIQRTTVTDLPKLITVPSPNAEVSRTHLAVRLEGLQVCVVDLRSTNGSRLQQAGSAAEPMTPDHPYRVATGDTVEIGDGVVLRFAAAPD